MLAEVRPSEGSGVDMGWIVRRNHEERRQSGMKLLKQFTNRVERRMKVGLAAVIALAGAMRGEDAHEPRRDAQFPEA